MIWRARTSNQLLADWGTATIYSLQHDRYAGGSWEYRKRDQGSKLRPELNMTAGNANLVWAPKRAGDCSTKLECCLHTSTGRSWRWHQWRGRCKRRLNLIVRVSLVYMILFDVQESIDSHHLYINVWGPILQWVSTTKRYSYFWAGMCVFCQSSGPILLRSWCHIWPGIPSTSGQDFGK